MSVSVLKLHTQTVFVRVEGFEPPISSFQERRGRPSSPISRYVVSVSACCVPRDAQVAGRAGFEPALTELETVRRPVVFPALGVSVEGVLHGGVKRRVLIAVQ